MEQNGGDVVPMLHEENQVDELGLKPGEGALPPQNSKLSLAEAFPLRTEVKIGDRKFWVINSMGTILTLKEVEA